MAVSYLLFQEKKWKLCTPESKEEGTQLRIQCSHSGQRRQMAWQGSKGGGLWQLSAPSNANLRSFPRHLDPQSHLSVTDCNSPHGGLFSPCLDRIYTVLYIRICINDNNNNNNNIMDSIYIYLRFSMWELPVYPQLPWGWRNYGCWFTPTVLPFHC